MIHAVEARSSRQIGRRFAFCALVFVGIPWLTQACHGQSDRVSQLTSELRDASWVVRLDAAFALSKLKDPRTVDPLIAALKDMDADVRRSAATALGEIKDVRAIAPLILTLQDSGVQVRDSAVKALGQIGDPRAIEPLLPSLRDADAVVRQDAAEWLGHFNDRRTVEPLIASLKDTDPNVRLRVSRALDEINDRRAAAPFLEALRQNDSPVIGGAYQYFIVHGEAGSEDALIGAMAQFGSKEMALDFIKCGNQKLANAGRAWAKENGFMIVLDPNSSFTVPVVWGSERLLALSTPNR